MAASIQGGINRLASPSPGISIGRRRIPCFKLLRAALAERASPMKSGTWTWKGCKDYCLKINFTEHNSYNSNNGASTRNLVFLPTVSDVSTTEEWQGVAELVTSTMGWRAVTVDWPGFGLSERPPLDYTADLMEKFLVDFLTAADGPLATSDSSPGLLPFLNSQKWCSAVIVGAGHAATIAVKALAGKRVQASGMVAVAPTWAGPLPIVFGRAPEAESRYTLLRSALRAPGLGWAMYNVLVSSEGNIRKQYESHVYADSGNVTQEMVKNRLALTKREGARYGPAAFLTGKLDPCSSREEFVSMFQQLQTELNVPTLVMLSKRSPKRSKAEMEALSSTSVDLVEISGALLPQEEFPQLVAEELSSFLNLKF